MPQEKAGRPERTSLFVLAMSLVVAPAVSAQEHHPPSTVVFVCEHGSVKSVVATEWFNRLARERKLPFRSVSRGVTPDSAIPPAVEQNLRMDGFDVAGFTPKRLDDGDLRDAIYVVAIGVESAALGDVQHVTIETWGDIPPASEQYSASRDVIRERIEALLKKLARPQPRKNSR